MGLSTEDGMSKSCVYVLRRSAARQCLFLIIPTAKWSVIRIEIMVHPFFGQQGKQHKLRESRRRKRPARALLSFIESYMLQFI